MVSMFDFRPTGRRVESSLGMSSCVCVTGHIKDPMPLVKKSRASCPVVGFLLVSFTSNHHRTE